MAGAKIPLTFRIFKGDTLRREEPLTQPVMQVRKLSSSHLRLDDDSVSRMHAVIEVSGPGDISIIDLGSTKGTVVNGQKVNKAKLQDGDLIVLGDIRIELAIGEAAASADDDVPTRVNLQAAPPAQAPAPPAAAAPPARPAPPPVAAPPAVAAPPPAAAPPPPGMARPAAAARVGAAAPVAFGLDSADDLGGARAIEIAAMLSDSVVEVKHVSNPRGGKVTSTTYGLFAAGAFLLVLALIAFFIGVSNSKANKESFHRWTEIEQKPAQDWRPARLSVAYDFMAFGGLIG